MGPLRLHAGDWVADLAPEDGGGMTALRFGGHDILVPMPPARRLGGPFGAFWMIPWANRLDGGRLGTHRLPINREGDGTAIHGLSRDRPWQVDAAAPDRAVELARLALRSAQALGASAAERAERLLSVARYEWAAGMLHDAGVLVDYNDHHKHGFYLVLNAGLPGYRHPELAMIALLVRAHRKALPSLAPLDGILGDEEADRLGRLACCLRVAEQLERGRAGGVRALRVEAPDGVVRLVVRADGDPTVALWSAALETPAFQHAFSRRLEISVENGAG